MTQLYLIGPLSISNLPLSRLLQLFIFIIETFVSTILLQIISEKTIHQINKRING